jgi:hypothetical protein
MAVLLMSANEKAFEFAQEVTKQLLSLSTGVIALTVTFLTDVAGNATANRSLLLAAWILFLVSIAFGILALMAMAGSLSKNREASIYDRNIAIPASIQILTFFAGLTVSVIYGFTLLS